MRIGIFTSGLENLSFLNTLKQYNHTFVIYMDQDAWPLEDKSIEFQEKYVQQAINFLTGKKVDKIILHPMWELKYKDKDFILPLYQNIVKQSLKYSLVGKICLLGNDFDMDYVEKYLNNLDYQATERQKNIKKFNCCKIYKKNIGIWKYNTLVLGKRNWMLRKLIKIDLNKVFSLNVDTLLPTSYDVYHFQRIINQKKKKLRFQKTNDWEFLNNLLHDKENKYKIEFYGNGNINLFFKEKRWKILLK